MFSENYECPALFSEKVLGLNSSLHKMESTPFIQIIYFLWLMLQRTWLEARTEPSPLSTTAGWGRPLLDLHAAFLSHCAEYNRCCRIGKDYTDNTLPERPPLTRTLLYILYTESRREVVEKQLCDRDVPCYISYTGNFHCEISFFFFLLNDHDSLI